MNWMSMNTWWKRVLFVLGALVFAALMALLFGWLLMLLWNWLMPRIFGLPTISYWQGWGLILLSHLLFKGGGGHGGYGQPRRSHRGGAHRRGGKGHSGFNRSHDPEGFDDFKREFHHRMRQKWHDSDHLPQKEADPEQGDSDK